MDLLYHRYASPFLLLDQMIECGSLSDFISFIWEAKQEDSEWDFYLHKEGSDMSFEEFRESLKQTTRNQNMTKQTIETTINESMNMLNNFVPDDERGDDM